MSALLDICSWFFLVSGALFCVVGGIGLLRLPDFYTRSHGAGITDTLGAGLILIGLMFQGGGFLVTAKLALVMFFLFMMGPVVSHALMKAAYARGVRVRTRTMESIDAISS